MRLRPLLLGTALLLTACTTTTTSSSTPAKVASPPAAASPAAAPAAAGTVWICRPGAPSEPCTRNMDATVVTRSGATKSPFVPAKNPPADCFYVYPTVSRATTDNAPRTSSPEVADAVHAQAARFGSVCRLFAPAYRQVTTTALLGGRYFTQKIQDIAYGDVRAAWRDYLAHDNHGRPVVLIGHSQGAMLLTRLIANEIDDVPAVRAHLLSAILLGGNVTTAVGKPAGGSFHVIPTCSRAGATGCVIAYSSFATTPPGFSLFGRTGLPGQSVVCTDPTLLAGRRGLAHPEVPADRVPAGPRALPGTGFVTYPEQLRVSCRAAGGASWLQVTPVPGGAVPAFTADLGPAWGLHIADVTLALGDLVDAVRLQEAAHPEG